MNNFFAKQGGTSFRAKIQPVGPSCQVEETFFQLNKVELSLRATMDLVGPSRQALHVQYTSDGVRSLTTLTSPRSVACMRPWAWCVPTVSLSRTVIFR